LLFAEFDPVVAARVDAEPAGTHAVQETKIHGLGELPVGLGHARLAENLARGQGMEVRAPAVGVDHPLLAGDPGRNPQLDLAVVGHYEHVAGPSDEALA